MMNRGKSQAELEENYVNDLLMNPNALPPSGLDLETARFLRMLVVTKQFDRPEGGVKDRVWNRVLFAIHFTPESEESTAIFSQSSYEPASASVENVHHSMVPATTDKAIVSHPQTRKQQSNILMVLVATLTAVVFFSGLLIHTMMPALVNTDAGLELRTNAPAEPHRINASLDPGDVLIFNNVDLNIDVRSVPEVASSYLLSSSITIYPE